jgi:hypothetical protein
MWSISTMNLAARKFGLALESEKFFTRVVPQVSVASARIRKIICRRGAARKFGLALESEKLFAGVVPQVSLASRSNPKNYLPA